MRAGRSARGGLVDRWGRRRSVAAGVAAMGLVMAGGFFALSGLVAHFGLAKSEPGAEATVAPPAEVRLWFTQAPAEGSVAVRVVNANDESMPTDSLRRDVADPKMFRVGLPESLEVGEYSVRWRGIGLDGHAVRGRFPFSVRTP